MRPRGGLLGALALSLMIGACGSGQQHPASTRALVSSRSGSTTVQAAGDRFLNRYVTKDGRVIRHDQGGDIVSEGQAYAMLIAEIARPALVPTIWSWTSAHLGQPDGLFAWHANGSGQIIDRQSATDADVLLAYALLRYSGAGQAALHRAGRRVAGAVLAHESVMLRSGTSLPVAGPWALTSPPKVDPSYLMPGVFAALTRLTGDGRWAKMADAAIAMVGGLTGDGQRLPSDWAQLVGGRLVPIANPGGGAGVQYGLDAVRLPIWFATACSSDARQLAAGWWHNVLSRNGRVGPQALTLGGTTIDASQSPVAYVAGAAAATAAGDQGAAQALRKRAAALAIAHPTYYGDAWLTLGTALLDGTIGQCTDVRS